MRRMLLVGVVLLLSFFSIDAFAAVYKLETGVITNIDPQNIDGNWSVIYNGGAELGSTYPWSLFPGWMASLGVSSSERIGGNYSFKMHMKVYNPSGHWGVAATNSYNINNVLHVDAGTYVISGFFYKDYPISGGMYLDLNDLAVLDNNNEPTNDNIIVDKQALGWQFVYGVFRFTTPRNLSIRVVRDSLFYSGEDFYFDDISLTPMNEFRAPTSPLNSMVPEPVSSGLFLLGLAGIIFRKNR